MKRFFWLFLLVPFFIASTFTFLVYFFFGVVHRKEIKSGKIRYLLYSSLCSLLRPLDGLELLAKRKKRKVIRKFLVQLRLKKRAKKLLKTLKRPFMLIDWDDDDD